MKKISFILISLISIVICGVSFGVTYAVTMPAIVENAVRTEDYNAYFEKNEVDFILKGASQEQIQSFKAMDSVESVEDYYLSESTTVSVGNSKYSMDLYIMHNFNDLLGTPFVNNVNFATVDNPAVIDYYFANKAGLSVGDHIEIFFSSKKINATVCAVVSNNYVNKQGCVAIGYQTNKNDVDAAFDDGAFFNYCYVNATSSQTFDTYLKDNYQPRLNMPQQEDYEYDTDYVANLERFNNQNYYCAPYVVKVQKDSGYTKDMEATVAEQKTMAVVAICLVILIGDILVGVWYSIKLRPIGRSTGKIGLYGIIHAISFVVSVAVITLIAYVCSAKYQSGVAAIGAQSVFGYMAPLFIAAIVCAVVGEAAKTVATILIIRSGNGGKRNGSRR